MSFTRSRVLTWFINTQRIASPRSKSTPSSRVQLCRAASLVSVIANRFYALKPQQAAPSCRRFRELRSTALGAAELSAVDAGEVNALGGRESVALEVFVGDGPDGAAGGGEHQLFDRYSEDEDAEKVLKRVVPFHEVGIKKEEVDEQQKIKHGEIQRTRQHQANKVRALDRDDDCTGDEGNDHVVDGLVRMPQLESEKENADHHKWRIVNLAMSPARLRKPLCQNVFTEDRSDASDGSCPEKIFNADMKSSVEIEERRRRPILRNEKQARERERRRNNRAPDHLRPIRLADPKADDPRSRKDHRADEIRVVVARHRSHPCDDQIARIIYLFWTCPGIYGDLIEGTGTCRRITPRQARAQRAAPLHEVAAQTSRRGPILPVTSPFTATRGGAR